MRTFLYILLLIARLPMALFCAFRSVVRRLLLPGRIARLVAKHRPCCEYHTGYLIAPVIVEAFGLRHTCHIYQQRVQEAHPAEVDEIIAGVIAWLNDNVSATASTKA